MAHSRMSSDIFSPIHSDVSLNDASAHSFGSFPDTPVFDKSFDLSRNRHIEKDFDHRASKSAIKEKASTFEMAMADIKTKASINAEKEEKFKDTYEQLKHSMDELFYIQDSEPSFLTPDLISKNEEVPNINRVEDLLSKFKTEKHEKIKAENSACSTQTSPSLVSESDKDKKSETLWDKYCNQGRQPIPNSSTNVENKSRSLEKTIKIAMGMEMDKLRSFILYKNMQVQKEILQIQELQKKQGKETEYLLSVLDELMENNRKLMAEYAAKFN